MGQYQLHYSGRVILEPRPDHQRQIPVAADNSDYQTYLAWVAAGNTPDPADPAPPPDPLDVADQADLAAFPTRAQVLAALTQLNTDLTTLGGAPTNAQLVTILTRTVTNQRAIIKALAVYVRRQGSG